MSNNPLFAAGPRFASIDALRGVAIVWMTAFHFCFDLNHFGYLQQDFYNDPWWTWQRSAIVSLFLFCAGLGQSVAVDQRQDTRRFWKRWAQVAGCALLVTVSSYFVFPKSFIYFGVLHGIALMLLIVRFTSGWGRWLWLAGAAAIALKFAASGAHAMWPSLDFLNSRPWNWLGLISRKPQTEDYVPLIPWVGAMWWGMAAGQWLLERRRDLLNRPLARAWAPFAWLGRWSLSWYVLHQPILFGILLSLR